MTLKTIGVFVFIVFVFHVKCYHSSGFGRCPKYIALRNFNVSKVVGTWYEIERTFHLMELITSCVSLNIWQNERRQLQVTVRTISRWSGSIIISRGTAIPNKKIASIFSYKVDSTLPNLLAKYLPGAGIYQFLETDYENFAVISTCADLGIFYVDQIWIFGRKREFNATLRMQLYELLERRRIDVGRLVIPKERNCSVEETFSKAISIV